MFRILSVCVIHLLKIPMANTNYHWVMKKQNGIVLLIWKRLEMISSLNNNNSFFPHIKFDRHSDNETWHSVLWPLPLTLESFLKSLPTNKKNPTPIIIVKYTFPSLPQMTNWILPSLYFLCFRREYVPLPHSYESYLIWINKVLI